MAPKQSGPGLTALALEPPQPASLPQLYSFRRCPYAIRARLALAAAGLVPGRHLLVREVNLACKPPELLEASAKGTVPVLVVPTGSGRLGPGPGPSADAPAAANQAGAPASQDTPARGEPLVIDQSLSLMRWALAHHDPADWLRLGASPAAGAARAEMAALIAENDGPFKHHLDRFKYPERFRPRRPPGASPADPLGPAIDQQEGLQEGPPRARPRLGRDGAAGAESAAGQGREAGVVQADGDEPERHRHRAAALGILRGWDDRLKAGGWLLGPRACLADWALLPFVRQFRRADPAGFDAEPGLAALQDWLGRFEACPQLAAVLAPAWGPRQPWRSPRWLYHLALAEEWRQARAVGVYRRSTRGLGLEDVGFIHASYAHQLAATYGRFYGDAGAVVLLTIDPARLEQAGVPVRAEAAGPDPQPGAELFPHLYGPLPLAAVVAAAPYQP